MAVTAMPDWNDPQVQADLAAGLAQQVAATPQYFPVQPQNLIGTVGPKPEEVPVRDYAAEAEARAIAREAARAEAALQVQLGGARAALTELLTTYGMQSLAGRVHELVGRNPNVNVVAENLRKTSEYKLRFKGLVQMHAKGITDISNEKEYLDLETDYRQVFREAGIKDYLGTSGTQEEYDSIASLVGDYSVSVNEVRARVGDAQRVVADTPQGVKDKLQEYYGVDSATMVEFALDSEKTMNKINAISNAAIIGGYSFKQGLDIDVNAGELIGGLYGDEDVNMAQLGSRIEQGVSVRDSTSRLADLEGLDLTDSESLLAFSGSDAAATKKVKQLQSRERARFGGSAGIGRRALDDKGKI
jgi:hypothetical protein